jgi:hypothetical protein
MRPPESSELERHIEAVESAYEFTLAYAAQGRLDDVAGPGPRIRDVLDELLAALDALADMIPDDVGAFRGVVVDDLAKSRAAVALVLGCRRIGSELIDNLNASIHLRALLTDLFLISEARAGGAP